ncbi:MFS transporter [Microbacterium betulae]|uniref:MFS transporter n=1 Tax=Microbacterium betulae TaxID=2981139 RepID=A0AA97FFR2_9MICO|nr:MFS transporter [Microbacterium sp. AB]WOF21813.1 MFS transporter [Microbacterium sp. AB]
MTAAAQRTGRAFPWFVVIALLTASLTLRAPILAVTPVLRDIERAFGVDATTVSLLTTLPILMFAAVTPIAALVIRRAGAEIALLVCLSATVVGTLLRVIPGFGWMLTGMIVIGAGITIGNVVVPVIIRRDVPPGQVAAVTAGYAALLNVGSLIVTLGTAPLARQIGWSAAILSWIWITLLGLVLWLLHMWRDRVPGETWAERYSGESGGAAASAREDIVLTGPVPTVSGDRSLLRRPIVWLLVATFCCQSAGYYALSTWLPTLIGETTGSDATQAGAFASIFQGAGIVGALLVPLLAHRLPIAAPAAVVSACWLGLSAGLLFAPDLFLLWTAVGGVAHGGGFVVVITVLVKNARTDAEAGAGSALVQGGGYVFGALGAPVIGAVHEATGGWTAPLGVTLSLAAGFTVFLASAIVVSRR